MIEAVEAWKEPIFGGCSTGVQAATAAQKPRPQQLKRMVFILSTINFQS